MPGRSHHTLCQYRTSRSSIRCTSTRHGVAAYATRAPGMAQQPTQYSAVRYNVHLGGRPSS
eukprot:3311807-Rhodomonas_salina.1